MQRVKETVKMMEDFALDQRKQRQWLDNLKRKIGYLNPEEKQKDIIKKIKIISELDPSMDPNVREPELQK